MSAEGSFESAKALLQEDFWNETRITAAYMVLSWSAVKVGNVLALQDYALFLHGCNISMADLLTMRELDMAPNLRIIIAKLHFIIKELKRTFQKY